MPVQTPDYQVTPNAMITFTAFIGNGQGGSCVAYLGDPASPGNSVKVGSGNPIPVTSLGLGSTLTGKKLTVGALVVDTNPATDLVDLTVNVDGAPAPLTTTQKQTVNSGGSAYFVTVVTFG